MARNLPGYALRGFSQFAYDSFLVASLLTVPYFFLLSSYCIVFELVRVTKACRKDKDFYKLKKGTDEIRACVRKTRFQLIFYPYLSVGVKYYLSVVCVHGIDVYLLLFKIITTSLLTYDMNTPGCTFIPSHSVAGSWMD